jgi:streptomycin 6-kinase
MPGDSVSESELFGEYLDRWDLVAEGVPLRTMSSALLAVARGTTPAMLKIALEPEEQRGNRLMPWWNGRGAAPVLAQEGNVLLMARAVGSRALPEMAGEGEDEEVTRILCRAAARLHSGQAPPPDELVSLTDWFAPLTRSGETGTSLLDLAAATARSLVEDQRESVVLHGDIHHGNVLDFGGLGWLAIDPKGLFGERTFDLVNILRNPRPELALAPGRLARHASIIALEAKVDRVRLLRWLLAFSGLSAAWLLEDGEDPEPDLAIADLVTAELGV